MKRFLFKFFLIFINCTFSGFARAECAGVSLTDSPTNTAENPKLLLRWPTPDEKGIYSYVSCGYTTDNFYNCATDTISIGADGYAHKCTKDGWEKIQFEDIRNCTDIAEFASFYDAVSNTASAAQSNKLDWVLVADLETFHKAKDICKYLLTDYLKQEDSCLIKGGEFMSYGSICNTDDATTQNINITDNNNNILDDVAITITNLNTPTKLNIKQKSGGIYPITIASGFSGLKFEFSKTGYISLIKTGDELIRDQNVILSVNQSEMEPSEKSGIIDKTKSTGKIKEEKQNESPKSDPNSPSPDPKESEEKFKSAQDALTKAKEAENSWANRGVTAASSAMTGLGGMAAASAIAEQRADAEAEKQMRAYIETMKCEYGNGQNVKLGNEEITLPGGNELLDYYTEYKQLADNLKATKSALGLRSGIESEVLYDRAQSGLYQYASIGKTGGAETSLYRALTDKESEDASAWAEQKEKSAKQLKTGALVAAAGVATGVIGNYLINGRNEKQEKLKEEFTKKTKEVENKYSNAVLIRPQTNSLGANLGKFNTNLPTFTSSQTQNTEQPAVTQPEPIQNKLTSLNIKDKSLFSKGEYTLDSNIELLNSYADNIIEVLNKDEYKDITIEISIIGHTDKIPVRKIKGRLYQNNRELSNLRAEEVEKYLRNKLSTLGSRVTYSHEGKGYDECTKDGDQQECRRVEITAKDTTDYSE